MSRFSRIFDILILNSTLQANPNFECLINYRIFVSILKTCHAFDDASQYLSLFPILRMRVGEIVFGFNKI